jgi:hypothetical protein
VPDVHQVNTRPVRPTGQVSQEHSYAAATDRLARMTHVAGYSCNRGRDRRHWAMPNYRYPVRKVKTYGRRNGVPPLAVRTAPTVMRKLWFEARRVVGVIVATRVEVL